MGASVKIAKNELTRGNLSTRILVAPIAQRTEHRSSELKPGMPIGAVRYELELLCQLPRPCFEARVPFGDILSFLVRRLFVAQMSPYFNQEVSEMLHHLELGVVKLLRLIHQLRQAH